MKVKNIFLILISLLLGSVLGSYYYFFQRVHVVNSFENNPNYSIVSVCEWNNSSYESYIIIRSIAGNKDLVKLATRCSGDLISDCSTTKCKISNVQIIESTRLIHIEFSNKYQPSIDIPFAW